MKNLLDSAGLKAAIDKVHRAGMPGVFAEVRDGDQLWRGADGVADLSTGVPLLPICGAASAASPRLSSLPQSCNRSRADLNRFYGLLLAGEIVNRSSLEQMQRTVPVIFL